MASWVESSDKEGPPTDAQLKYARASLGNVTLNDDEARRALLDWFFGIASTDELTAAQCSEIIGFVGATDTNDYQPSGYAITEAQAVVKAWRIAEGQQEMEL